MAVIEIEEQQSLQQQQQTPIFCIFPDVYVMVNTMSMYARTQASVCSKRFADHISTVVSSFVCKRECMVCYCYCSTSMCYVSHSNEPRHSEKYLYMLAVVCSHFVRAIPANAI